MQGQKVVTGMIYTKSSTSGNNPLRNDLYGFCPAGGKSLLSRCFRNIAMQMVVF